MLRGKQVPLPRAELFHPVNNRPKPFLFVSISRKLYASRLAKEFQERI
jgi:hypothetical protein